MLRRIFDNLFFVLFSSWIWVSFIEGLDPELPIKFLLIDKFTAMEDCDGRIKEAAEMDARQAEAIFIYRLLDDVIYCLMKLQKQSVEWSGTFWSADVAKGS